ncbi:MAG TPA: M14 family metallopeptidase [Vicinamibacterales bacterium]|nr:M14 family metallopeptidase [Vicinamibacterales bacterium]
MRRKLSLVITFLLLSTPISAQRGSSQIVSPQDLGKIWDAEHVSPPLPPLLLHAEAVKRLEGVVAGAPDLFRMEKVGESVEGRALNLIRAGSGSFPVLLWSQMHGDEPTATAALFDIFEFLRRHREDPTVRDILSSLTLYFLPMLNPDGAERFQRRNAQSIDINRDALRLQTPEGRTLKAVRDRFQPRIGFNLHNQAWRTSVGRPPKPASISLLSVAFDEARSASEGRTLTKKVCAVIREALEPFASGQIGRYDDEFEVRAFGDNLTLWGTPVVLIETGPWPSSEPDPALVKLNFVAILSALDALATGAVHRANTERYDSLPVNESGELYVIVKNGTVISGAGVPPYVADIGIVASRRIRDVNGKREMQVVTSIDDMGDLRTLGALRTIDAIGMTIVPLVSETIEAGQIVDLPEWKTVQPATLAVGQPGRMVLLKPAPEPGKYQVELVLK